MLHFVFEINSLTITLTENTGGDSGRYDRLCIKKTMGQPAGRPEPIIF